MSEVEDDEEKVGGSTSEATEPTLADMQKQIEELRKTMAASLRQWKAQNEEQILYFEAQIKAIYARNVRIDEMLEQHQEQRR